MNLFTRFLSLLKVRHTESFSEKHYGEHPYKYTLYGLSRMLTDYKIPNAGVKLNNKDEIVSLESPFVAQVSTDFVLVTKMSNDSIEYIWKDKDIKISFDKFKDIWTGVALLAEPDGNSSEPDYKRHLMKERFILVEKIILCFLTLITIFFSLTQTTAVDFWLCIVLIIINGVGLYVSYLLLLKQMKISSQSADKICSLFKKSDCNDVLETPAAKIFDVIGWSEVGFAYFVANLLLVVFFPQLLLYAVLINVFALPYTIWSVWYQKFIAKQWCMLCLIVQVLLWLTFMSFLLFGTWGVPPLELVDIVILISLFALPLLVMNLLLPKLSEARKVTKLAQEFASLRLKDEVFLTCLKLQPHYEVDRSISQIVFGNPDSNLLITILTNPHCNPCARMHHRIEALLDEIGDYIAVQYVFSSFSDEMESSGKFLTAVYVNHPNDKDFIDGSYNEWFSGGKNDREAFFAKYAQDMDSEVVNREYERHIQWRDQTKLRATPTTLVNGYELPDNYVVEDLKYFINLEI